MRRGRFTVTILLHPIISHIALVCNIFYIKNKYFVSHVFHGIPPTAYPPRIGRIGGIFLPILTPKGQNRLDNLRV